MVNRELQLLLLERLKAGGLKKYQTQLEASEYRHVNEVDFNLRYLSELGLLECTQWNVILTRPDNHQAEIAGVSVTGRITAKGVDFLEDDGGISAILGTVKVKLHADTLRGLIDAKIVENEAIPEQEKHALREALKGMKEEGLKQLTTRLISYGLDQGAITAQQLSTWLNI
ncbi:hypothetical protein ACT3UM_02435 [Halomonas sp. AOP13-D3-9]